MGLVVNNMVLLVASKVPGLMIGTAGGVYPERSMVFWTCLASCIPAA